MENLKRPGYLTGYIFLLIFVFLAAGIVTSAYFAYKNYEKNYRIEVESQLSSVAKLKVDQLIQWRKERLGDGQIFFKNDLFSVIVKRYIRNQNDRDAKKGILTWVGRAQSAYRYDLMMLLDAQLNTVLIFPENKERTQLIIDKKNTEILLSGNIAFQDFYRNDQDQHIYLKILIPILEDRSPQRLIAVLALRISPEEYLYPLIQEWPIPSRTAETLIIRREGDNAQFLNELRFQKNTALNYRIPISSGDLPAVKAALGQEGIVEGIDYRGAPVIADVRTVPDSPWFLVARIDKEEVYGPLKERMWLIIFIVGALFIAAGTGVGFIWRYQHSRFYQEQYKSTEALQESEEKFRTFFEHSSSALAIIEKDTTISVVNKEYCKIGGYDEKDVIGTSWTKQIVPEDLERLKEYNRKRLLDPKNAPDNYEFKFYRKDGQIRNALMSVAFIPSNQKIICSFTDITERKRMENEIKQNEEKLKEAQHIAKMGNWELDLKINTLIWSDGIYELFEINPAEFGASYEAFLSAIHPDDREMVNLAYTESLKKRIPYEISHRLLMKNGRVKWVNEICHTEYDGKGNPVKSFGIIQDITERKKAEEALKETSDYLNNLFTFANAPIIVWDPEFRITRFNHAFESITGRSAEDVIGKYIELLFPEETKNKSLEYILNTVSGKRWETVEIPIQHIDGTINTLLWNSANIYGADGKTLLSTIAQGQNITKRKQVEEALRKSSEMVQLLLNSTAEAIYGLDMDGLCTFNNTACLKILGYEEPEQLLGKNMHELIHSKHADGTPYNVHQCPIFKAFKSGTKEHVDTEVLWRKDGTSFPSEYWSYPVRQDGVLIGAVVTFLDITKRKHAEFELQKSAEAREILIKELQTALDNVKTLQGLIPICANCKKIRDDKGFWNQVEGYLSEHTDAKFSHGLCPDCGKLLYGDLYDKAAKKREENKTNK